MTLTSVSYFFGGVFLGNAIPHFVSGTMGRAFQSPFASPPGKGLSSALVNVGWGASNILVGYVLVLRVGTFDLRKTTDALALGASRCRPSRPESSDRRTAEPTELGRGMRSRRS